MSKSLLSSLATSLIVALGIGAAWCLAFIWVAAMTASAVQNRQGYELLYVTFRGEPVIVAGSGAAYGNQEVVDLARQPVQVNTQQLLYPVYLGRQRLEPAGREQWQTRLAAVNDGRSPATYWYLVHDGQPNGRAYGVGYHSRTRQLAGYFGTRGFTERMPPRSEWFETPGSSGLAGLTPLVTTQEPYWSQPLSRLFFIADGKLWVADPAEKKVASVVDCPAQSMIGMAYVIPDESNASPSGLGNLATANSLPKQLLLHEGERVTLVDPDTLKSHTFPLPAELQEKMIAGIVLPNDQLLVMSIDDRRNFLSGDALASDGLPMQEAVWIDREGKITRREEVRLAFPTGGDPRVVAWLGVVSAPMPLAGLMMALVIPLELRASGAADSYASALGMTLGFLWPSLAGLCAIGCVTAALTYRRQRRFGLPGAVAWAVFAFVLGIPGWIAYRFHRTWPVIDECPACRQPAPRDREACTECGGEFPPPPLKGIEVFA